MLNRQLYRCERILDLVCHLARDLAPGDDSRRSELAGAGLPEPIRHGIEGCEQLAELVPTTLREAGPQSSGSYRTRRPPKALDRPCQRPTHQHRQSERENATQKSDEQNGVCELTLPGGGIPIAERDRHTHRAHAHQAVIGEDIRMPHHLSGGDFRNSFAAGESKEYIRGDPGVVEPEIHALPLRGRRQLAIQEQENLPIDALRDRIEIEAGRLQPARRLFRRLPGDQRRRTLHLAREGPVRDRPEEESGNEKESEQRQGDAGAEARDPATPAPARTRQVSDGNPAEHPQQEKPRHDRCRHEGSAGNPNPIGSQSHLQPRPVRAIGVEDFLFHTPAVGGSAPLCRARRVRFGPVALRR